MNATETTSLLANASTSTGTSNTTSTSNGTTTPESTAKNKNHNSKNNSNGSSSSTCLIGIGFSLGLFISCIVMLAFVLGYLLSSNMIYNIKQLQTSSSTNAPPSTNDYTMKVTTTDTTDTTIASSSSFEYVATQFISFTINTMGGLQEHGECDEDSTTIDPITGVCYLGDAHNITHDIEHRLEIVKTIVKRIKLDSFQESPDIDHIDNVDNKSIRHDIDEEDDLPLIQNLNSIAYDDEDEEDDLPLIQNLNPIADDEDEEDEENDLPSIQIANTTDYIDDDF